MLDQLADHSSQIVSTVVSNATKASSHG